MFVKKFVAFMLGFILASAWWQAVVFQKSDHTQWIVTILVTTLVVIVIIFNCAAHIDDK